MSSTRTTRASWATTMPLDRARAKARARRELPGRSVPRSTLNAIPLTVTAATAASLATAQENVGGRLRSKVLNYHHKRDRREANNNSRSKQKAKVSARGRIHEVDQDILQEREQILGVFEREDSDATSSNELQQLFDQWNLGGAGGPVRRS
ncbi:unnamed protein product [Polarella glacialis]|uniref:Uncharacterized protein n=1 Tax=Polarella glacialis TaxID=89957 RepID=A0A813FGW4_POLGL|nr:unnamed protein product [Polarella glacialis]